MVTIAGGSPYVPVCLINMWALPPHQLSFPLYPSPLCHFSFIVSSLSFFKKKGSKKDNGSKFIWATLFPGLGLGSRPEQLLANS